MKDAAIRAVAIRFSVALGFGSLVAALLFWQYSDLPYPDRGAKQTAVMNAPPPPPPPAEIEVHAETKPPPAPPRPKGAVVEARPVPKPLPITDENGLSDKEIQRRQLRALNKIVSQNERIIKQNEDILEWTSYH